MCMSAYRGSCTSQVTEPSFHNYFAVSILMRNFADGAGHLNEPWMYTIVEEWMCVCVRSDFPNCLKANGK